MRKNFRKQSWLYSMPVLIVSAYRENGTPDEMAIGWCEILDMKHLSLRLIEGHKTAESILKSGAFISSVANFFHLDACDYVGNVSGHDVPDKVAKSGFHTTKSEFINAPVIEELPWHWSVNWRVSTQEPDI